MNWKFWRPFSRVQLARERAKKLGHYFKWDEPHQEFVLVDRKGKEITKWERNHEKDSR